MPRWHAKWAGWIVAGLLLEAIGLREGGPLTRSARTFVVGSAGGSFLVGGFLAWLFWHWLAVDSGLGLGDAVSVVAGGLVAVALWAHRIGRVAVGPEEPEHDAPDAG